MTKPASEETRRAGNLFARTVPGARACTLGLAAMVPLSGAGLVALDARATGVFDWTLAGAAGVFVVLSAFIVAKALPRLRCVAVVADAVEAASLPAVTPGELRIDPALGRPAQSWNQIVDRFESGTLTGGVESHSGVAIDPVIDSLAEGVIVVGGDLAIIRANPAATALLPGDTAPDADVNLTELQPAELAEVASAVLAGGPVRRETIECGTEEAPQVLRVRVGRVVGSRDRVLLTMADITRQSVAESSRGNFLARATHELRAPLTNIKLYAEQAVEEGDDDPQLRQEALNVIGREVLRLERTVGDLLRVSELESGSLRGTRTEIRVDDMLTEIREAFVASAEAKSIGLTLDAPPKLPTLLGDRDHIEAVIQNLVGNAIKYTPAGGSVLMRADADEHEFTLEVIDDGIGIAPEEALLVFETFFRSDDARVHDVEGSGLGLSLARQLARQHGGDVTVESELNRGSTFTLRVPVGRGEAAAGGTLHHRQADASSRQAA
ncbi:MAG: HAMP domain-containing sensor histidine kinase [Planctomycetota bacterium]